jgi:hypothetical protein
VYELIACIDTFQIASGCPFTSLYLVSDKPAPKKLKDAETGFLLREYPWVLVLTASPQTKDVLSVDANKAPLVRLSTWIECRILWLNWLNIPCPKDDPMVITDVMMNKMIPFFINI